MDTHAESLRAQPQRFSIPLRSWELADLLGLTSREVERALEDLERRRLVRSQSNELLVLDPAGLRTWAETLHTQAT